MFAASRIALIFLAGIAFDASGQWQSTLNTDAGVSIKVDSPFAEGPRCGYVPIRVVVKNDTSSNATYDLRGSATIGYGPRRESTSTEQQLRVPARATASAELLIPVAPREPGVSGPGRQVRVTVIGPGVRDNGTVSFPGSGVDGKNAFVAMSSELALRSWSPIRAEAEKQGNPVAGTQFDVERLGADWRALTGVASLWVTAAEFDRLSPNQRGAILGWIAQGGHMVWVVQNGSGRTLAEFGAAADEAGPHRIGLGQISQREWDGHELNVDETLAAIAKPSPSLEKALTTEYRSWDPMGNAGDVRLPVAFLATFMTLFAIVVGPVNLFWLAGEGRRHRLFWTTPVISLVASTILAVTILVQDGLGGAGFRVAFAYADPTRNQLVLRQEQVSRTGLLLNRRFALAESALVTPIDLDGTGSESNREWTQDGRELTGGLFVSRSVQAQYLESVIPARARVERVADENNSTAPALVSTLPQTLDRIFYIDSDGGYWTGGPLRTGEKVTLIAADETNARQFMNEAAAKAGPLVRGAWMRNFPVNGTFYGAGVEGPFLDTLETIRWDRKVALVSGPVVDATVSSGPNE